MNILWLSWRDIKNPNSGGAEKVALEISKRFVDDKNKVTIFTSHFSHAKDLEIINGVKIIRKGNSITCRLFAFLHYITNQKKYDLIIDEINTIPFFTTLYAKNKSVTLIHQLAKEYWFSQTYFPLNIIGYFSEAFWLKLYKKQPALVLSNSTKADLKKLGFKNISTYRIGLDIKPQLITKKENLILFIGRLTYAKGPHDAIRAFKIIHATCPQTKLSIVGKGNLKFISSLRKLIQNLSLEKSVKLEGFVTQSKKLELLKKAKIVLIPSAREGWNLVATEANATATIPIGYNVPGLRDSINNGKNGLLVNNAGQMAAASLNILRNDSHRTKIAKYGVEYSKNFAWDNCFNDFSNFIFKNVSKVKKSDNFFRWIILIAVAGFLIRLSFSVLLPLDSYDETFDILIPQKSISQMLQVTSAAYPPIWHLILHFLEKFSQSYIFLRFFAVILGTFSIVVAGYLGKKIFNRNTGILTAIIFTLTPTQIYYSSILRLYSFSILVSLLIFHSFVNFLNNNSKKSKFFLLATITLGNYTYYLFPILYISFLFHILFDKNLRKTKLRSFIYILTLCVLLSLPLLYNFLKIEKLPLIAFPTINILKIISIPLSYSFPLNLAQSTNLYPYLKLNFTNIALLFFSAVSFLILLKALIGKSKKLILIIPLVAAPTLALIFSLNIKSVFGIRSLVIFSIPFYLLIANALTSKKLGLFYTSLSAIVVIIIFTFFLQRQTSPAQLFIQNNIPPQDIIIHTELTTFTYYSYLYPQFRHKAAVDSLWTTNINKQTLNYIPVKTDSLSAEKFWLLEYPTDIHKEMVNQFKQDVLKTHTQTFYENFGETSIYKYEPN